MSELIVITYETEEKGYQALEKVEELQKMSLITLEDAAVAIMNQKGKVKVKQTLEKKNTGKVATWGAFWGLLIGLIFLAPIFWGLFGALLGAIFGKASDLGIDNKFIKEVGHSLEPGNSALFLLVIQATTDKVLPELEKFGGSIYQTSLSEEDEQKLKDSLEHEHVSGAAQESLELDEEAATE